MIPHWLHDPIRSLLGCGIVVGIGVWCAVTDTRRIGRQMDAEEQRGGLGR